MTRNESGPRGSNSTGKHSWQSSDTITPSSYFDRKSSRTPAGIDTAGTDDFDQEPVSPTTTGVPRFGTSTSSNSNVSPMTSFDRQHRRDLAGIDPSGGRVPHIQQQPSTGNSPNPIAPWSMSPNNGSPVVPSSAFGTSFYDSSDNLSQGSQLSPVVRPGTGRTGNTTESPDAGYFGDDRRPSVASVTTASSTGSKSSVARTGVHKSLKGFFGDDFPGREGSETSSPAPPPIGKEQKDYRSNSYTRNRNLSNATDATPRESSPASSRPRTPVPSSDVVPFLYQDSKDISVYGDAPVRGQLSGPDKGRYATEDPVPPKTSSSSRSHRPSRVHLPGQGHRHNKSSDDSKSLRPSISREDTPSGTQKTKEKGSTIMAASAVPAGASKQAGTPRSKSPAPVPSSDWNVDWGGPPTSTPPAAPKNSSAKPVNGNAASNDQGGHSKRRLGFSLFKRSKDHKDDGHASNLKNLPSSQRSLQSSHSEKASYDVAPDVKVKGREASVAQPSNLGFPPLDNAQFAPRPSTSRQGTFGKLPFARKGKNGRDEIDMLPGVAERGGAAANGAFHNLDLDLSNMEGIVSQPQALPALDGKMLPGGKDTDVKLEAGAGPAQPVWDAPDSWAVEKEDDEIMSRLPEIDEAGIPQKEDERSEPYSIRVFRSDGTYATLSMSLNATVSEVIGQLGKKSYMTDPLEKYQIIMKKHDLQRTLQPGERPMFIQKRLLQQAGYEDKDKIEDVGREDNSYLCRFLFVPAHASGYAAISQDPAFSKVQKYSSVNLAGRNLITIPIALYSKASEIISLDLSRNLSLDVPKDFIQSCLNLRDVKFISNEAWKLPPSISRANRLTVLDVSNNRLEQLDNAELSRLQSLTSLKLANNRLTHLPSYFNAFRAMRTLNVSSNFLTEFPTLLCELPTLVDIDLSFNAIKSVPTEIGQLQNLERFVITNNKLAGALPPSFGELANLREVDIRYNALSTIDVIASLPKIEQLSADHNGVSVFEGSFQMIKTLRLNSNPVTRFEIQVSVPTLTTLVLSNAKLAHIPESSFDKMPNLVKLVLDKNHFVSLPHHIGKLRHLEHLSIARNALSSLPAEIGCLTELRFLDISQNNLKKLPGEIWWAGKLETLNISSNVLNEFPKPGARPPTVPDDMPPAIERTMTGGIGSSLYTIPQSSSTEELGSLEAFDQRRPSQASSSILSSGSPPPVDRKNSVVSVYGKGGRKTSVVSRTTSQSTLNQNTPPHTITRKDSNVSTKLQGTFASSMRNLYLADNELDDEIFNELTLLGDLRVLNLSYNDLADVPQRSLRAWPQLVELYLSGNELSSLPADDLEEFSLLQVLFINGNRFQTLPSEFGKAKRLAVLDCGSNSLKYNVSNWPYDWNWNFNTALRYLNLSGNKRLNIKPNLSQSATREMRHLTDFSALTALRILGLMDVTLTIPTVPDETEDRRVRTSASVAGSLSYGMADSLGRNEHLSTIDMVVPRFNSDESALLVGMFDGQALSSGGSKIAKYLHENFSRIFADELKAINPEDETPVDALRRSFLSLNKDLATAATQHMEERSLMAHRGSAAPAVLSQADLHSGGVATIMYLQAMELYVANVGDAQAMLIQSEGSHRILTRKHDPAEPGERKRIRDAGGWVSRQGKLNDVLEVSRAFGYVQLMPAVQAAPNITQVTLKESDEMVLIASREVWEFLSPDLIVDVARSERIDLMRAAQRLRDLAIAFGATNKIMVMMVGVSDLKKRERMRLNRGTSMSLGPLDETYVPSKRGRRAKDGAVEDSMLRRLEAEVQAPTGDIAIVFTDIKGSTFLWETYSQAMRAAIKLHNEVMRRQLRIIGGYEVKTEGDAFMVSFPTATSALLWSFAVQSQLLEVQWPSEILSSAVGKEILDSDQNVIFRGLSVRMGIHWGDPVCENDPVTRRMDYFGPMVNKAARISSVADGGQISVSTDFISELQRCWEAFPDNERSGSTGSEETFEADVDAQALRRELNSLSMQGYEIKDMGERKLKGLENPEFIYLMYPHSLSGRMYFQPKLQIDPAEGEEPKKTATAALQAPLTRDANAELAIEPDAVFMLWKVSLRLEMICTMLEEGPGATLRQPQYHLLEQMQTVGGEVSDDRLIGFMTHLTTRVETAVATIEMRHLASKRAATPSDGDDKAIKDLTALSSNPLYEVMIDISKQLAELRQYKEKYGELKTAS